MQRSRAERDARHGPLAVLVGMLVGDGTDADLARTLQVPSESVRMWRAGSRPRGARMGRLMRHARKALGAARVRAVLAGEA